MSDPQISGRCMCGSITYSSDADPAAVVMCHCDDCQRQSGAAFSLNVVVARDQFAISGDTQKVYRTVGDESGEERERVFCSTCGSPIITVMAEAQDLAIIKAGTLDDRSWLMPEMEVWTEGRHPWVTNGEERGEFPRGLPT